MKFTYQPRGVCSRLMEFEIEDGILKDIIIRGGCNGNLKGISALVKGMRVDDVIAKLDGIDCSGRGTSCPDQLARGLKLALEK